MATSPTPLDFIREESTRRPSYPAHNRRPGVAQAQTSSPRVANENSTPPTSYWRNWKKSSRASQRTSDGQQFRVGNIGQNGALYLRWECFWAIIPLYRAGAKADMVVLCQFTGPLRDKHCTLKPHHGRCHLISTSRPRIIQLKIISGALEA